ncbi:MAG: formylglycine-generating enzyme family protein, partial [Alphaproteobacteria bacterium]|nr:formylglycine-generating enzyme family protein [Alphaproteobacteria bacterium]
YENLGKAGARSVTVYLDACFSGDSQAGMLIRSASPVFVKAEMPTAARGITVLAAAQGEQMASWDEKAKHGLFTEHLLRALYGAADKDRTGRVTASMVKAYLDREMTYAARREFGRDQVADLKGDEGRVLASYQPGRPPPRPQPAQPAVGQFPAAPSPGQVVRDCAECPEMVVIPAGSFVMGVAPGEEEREGVPDNLKGRSVPQHSVNVRSFMLGKYEVTVGEFGHFVNETGYRTDGGCFAWTGTNWGMDASKSWRNPGFGQGERHPVTCVNWNDAKAYTAWLSRKTGKSYRLASEAEWEYAARAGTTTARYWGNDVNQGCGFANVSDQTTRAQVRGITWGASCNDGHAYTAPVGSFRTNGFGLHDMIGKVWEFTEDCWNENYNGAPADGSAWLSGNCNGRVLRGGSWYDLDQGSGSARAADRFPIGTSGRANYFGFRVARTN